MKPISGMKLVKIIMNEEFKSRKFAEFLFPALDSRINQKNQHTAPLTHI